MRKTKPIEKTIGGSRSQTKPTMLTTWPPQGPTDCYVQYLLNIFFPIDGTARIFSTFYNLELKDMESLGSSCQPFPRSKKNIGLDDAQIEPISPPAEQKTCAITITPRALGQAH